MNFEILKYKISNIKNENIFINNFGLSDDKNFKFNQSKDSASSTLSEINSNSKYYKKKLKCSVFQIKQNILIS